MKKINIRRFQYKIRHEVLTTNNLVVVVALLIAASWAVGSVQVMERNYMLQKQINSKKQQLKLAELETATLRFQKKYYQTDEYKELAVRQRLGLGFPGETSLILPPNSKQASASDTNNSLNRVRTANKVTNTEQWVNFLLGGSS
jgi:hypothetical protein